MPAYEVTFIARQDLSKADVERLTKEYSDLIAGKGGTIVKDEYWGLRPLAYKVNKNKKGHYVFLGMEAPAEAVEEAIRNMRLSEEVIRFLSVKVEKIDSAPSAPLQRGRDDDRDNRSRAPRAA